MRGIFKPCNSLQNVSCSGKLRCHYREAFSSTKSLRPRDPRSWWRRMTPALVPGPRPSAELTPSCPPSNQPSPPSHTACPGTCSHGASCTTCPGCTGGCRHLDFYKNIYSIYIISALQLTISPGARQRGATGGTNATTILVAASRIHLYNKIRIQYFQCAA